MEEEGLDFVELQVTLSRPQGNPIVVVVSILGCGYGLLMEEEKV